MLKISRFIFKMLPATDWSSAVSREMAVTAAALDRYRETDAKRRVIHRKLKQRLQEEKAVARTARRELKEQVKARARVEAELEAARLILEKNAPVMARRGGEGAGEQHEALLKPTRQAALEKKAWRPWMRLGVLEQHPPRPFAAPGPPRRRVSAEAPVISIVTPSYQQGPFLEATLHSVLEQGYPKLEYIVMDGGSTDESVALIQKVAPRLAWWQSQRDGGHSAALLEGFARSTGEIMGWLNSDDLYLPGTLAYVADYFQKNPHVDAVYGHRVLVNEAGHELGRWYLPPHDGTMLLWADYVPQETWFWRRRVYEKCGGLDPSLHFAMDWDLLLRMQCAGAVFHRLPWFLGGFRVHRAQKSQAMVHDVGAGESALLRQRELGVHFNLPDLQRRSTAFQLRALRTKKLWHWGLRSVKF